MPASRLLRLPRMLVDRAYMPPPFGRRPGGIALRVSFSAADPGGNGFHVVLLEGDGGNSSCRRRSAHRRPGSIDGGAIAPAGCTGTCSGAGLIGAPDAGPGVSTGGPARQHPET